VLKSRFNAAILYTGCLGISPAISAQFTLECAPQRKKNRKKITSQTLNFGGSMSFKIIDVGTP